MKQEDFANAEMVMPELHAIAEKLRRKTVEETGLTTFTMDVSGIGVELTINPHDGVIKLRTQKYYKRAGDEHEEKRGVIMLAHLDELPVIPPGHEYPVLTAAMN